jgi:hypothetical protein
MTSHDFGMGPMLCVGWTQASSSSVWTSGGVSVFNPASYNSWTYLNPQWSGSVFVGSSLVATLLSRSTPAGPALTVGGVLMPVAGLATRGIFEWRGGGTWPPNTYPLGTWAPIGKPISAPVYCMTTHDDGTGPKLVVGGAFEFAGGVKANGVATRSAGAFATLGFPQWDYFWSGPQPQVLACVPFDFGSGPELVVAGSLMAGSVARGNGANWSWVGWLPPGPIRALCVHDDGSGPQLYAGGNILAGTTAALVAGVAKWDGNAWQPVGAGLWNVHALVSADLGSGPRLFAAGEFTSS